MTILAAIGAGQHTSPALHLASQIARTSGEQVIAVTVLEGASRVGADALENEYRAYSTAAVRRQLEPAVADASAGLDVALVVHHSSSIPQGLVELVAEFEASIVTLGSSSSGLLGRITLGSVTERLVHTARVPVALAPRGYSTLGALDRLTVAYGGAHSAESLILAAGELAVTWSLPLRVASFTVRPTMPYDSGTDSSAELLVVKQWAQRTEATLGNHLAEARTRIDVPDTELALGSGSDWRDAIDAVTWSAGDLILLGSGAAGPMTQVFLGSAASKILRHVSVPAMILPRR